MKSQSAQPPAGDKKNEAREYRTDDIIVYWYPKLCQHVSTCWKTLPQVFQPKERPWINLTAGSAEEIIKTIDRCPAGALKYELPAGSRIDPSLAAGPGSVDHDEDSYHS